MESKMENKKESKELKNIAFFEVVESITYLVVFLNIDKMEFKNYYLSIVSITGLSVMIIYRLLSIFKILKKK